MGVTSRFIFTAFICDKPLLANMTSYNLQKEICTVKHVFKTT